MRFSRVFLPSVLAFIPVIVAAAVQRRVSGVVLVGLRLAFARKDFTIGD